MLADPLQPDLSPRMRRVVVVGPFVLLAAAAAGLALPATRRVMQWVFWQENGAVEFLTFVFLFAGGVHALVLAARARRLRLGSWLVAFLCAFGAGFLVVGMEEIAWGQWFFHWQTPAFWSEINEKHETTLHNLTAVHCSTETFRIIFGAGGLVGIWLGRFPAFERVAAPRILGALFSLIGAHAVVDLVLDYAAPQGLVEKAFARTSELVEMYIGSGGWLYLRLSSRRMMAPVRGDAAAGALSEQVVVRNIG